MTNLKLSLLLVLLGLLEQGPQALAKEIDVVIDQDGHLIKNPVFIELYTELSVKKAVGTSTSVHRTTLVIKNNSPTTQKRLLWNYYPLMEAKLDHAGTTRPLMQTGLIASQTKNQHLNHPVFALEIPPGTNTYLIDTTLHGVPISLAWQIDTEIDYQNHMNLVETIVKMFLVTFATIWGFTLLFFLLLRQRFVVYYVLGQLCLAYSLLIVLGFPLDTPGFMVATSIKILPLLVSLSFCCYWLFVIYFLRTQENNKLNSFSLIQICINFCLGLLGTAYFQYMTEILLWFYLAQTIIFSSTIIYAHQVSVSRYWSIFFVANLPNIMGIFIVQLMYMGIIPFNQLTMLYQLLILIMVTTTMSIIVGYVAKEEDQAKAILESSVLLGSSVQNLLLPKKLAGNHFQLEYQFFYRPFESQMSGDWLHQWVTRDGTVHFLLGDVTGKGPQAALAVAMIASVVDYSSQKDQNARDCMHEINSCLYEMFQTKMLTTCSGASISLDGSAQLYNAGGLGWYLASSKGTKHHLTRASVVGLTPRLNLTPTTLALKPGDTLVTLSDGLGASPRILKKISNDLNTMTRQTQDLQEIIHFLAKDSGTRVDDQAMLAIKALQQSVESLTKAA